MADIKSMTLEELTDWMNSAGEASYRASQVYKWLHDRKVRSYDEMDNIPKSLRQKLLEEGELTTAKQLEVQKSTDGTCKYLFAMGDGSLVESVWMEYSHGSSVCISSQVGCRMGCRFCASTLKGLARNLTAAEMLEQVYVMSLDRDKRISNLVVMGMGEPLDNYDNLIRFIKILTSSEGLNLGRRSITVSTCGIVPRIYDLADENPGITLALSLHAVTDEKRKNIMPIANSYTIAETMKAVNYYFDNTGRRVTFEYALAEGVNDSEADARKLAELAAGAKAHVNLIPVNPVTERGYAPTSRRRVEVFKNKLENKGINVTIRRELGQDIDGACGQLRHRYMEELN